MDNRIELDLTGFMKLLLDFQRIGVGGSGGGGGAPTAAATGGGRGGLFVCLFVCVSFNVNKWANSTHFNFMTFHRMASN